MPTHPATAFPAAGSPSWSNHPGTVHAMNSALHHRITTVFGIFLILMAALILVSADRPTRVGVVVVAVGLGLLGLDAVVSGVRKRRPLVSRIGPLP